MDEGAIAYLRDVAAHPLSLATERDRRLGVSRYQGVQLRRRLADREWVRQHRVSTGRRSGRGVLLELTDLGRRRLEAAGVRVGRPPTRVDCRRRYYATGFAEYARRSWPGAAVEITAAAEPGGSSADVTVRIPARGGAEGGDALAMVAVVAGEEDALGPRLRALRAVDAVFVCAETVGATEALRSEAARLVPEASLSRVTFAPIGSFLPGPADRAERAAAAGSAGSARGRSRRSREDSALLGQVIEAYRHLDDLDWLDASPLARTRAVREQAMPLAPMPEAQALRRLLVDAARRAAEHTAEIPSHEPLGVFLRSYVAGKRVAEIAEELGVSREWCSRAYRKRALGLAGRQFARLAASRVGATD